MKTEAPAVTDQLVPAPLRRGLLLGALAALVPGAVRAQEQWSFPAGSSPFIVDRMVKFANLRDGDVVVDLGSFDGRIVIAAVRSNPKVRGWGAEIDADWVAKANEAAKAQGVADRAQFFHRNAFDVDLREVTVINMWLFRSLTQLLRPKILAEARPGTRVIVNGALIDNRNMLGNWQPDVVDRGAGDMSPIFMWIVPARVEGAWSWTLPIGPGPLPVDVILAQQFQMIEGHLRAGNRRETLTDARLRGDEINMSVEMTLEGIGRARQQYIGRVNGDTIKGTAFITPADGKPIELPWLARRASPGGTGGWFRPTGVDIK
jgi:hypothetical protein